MIILIRPLFVDYEFFIHFPHHLKSAALVVIIEYFSYSDMKWKRDILINNELFQINIPNQQIVALSFTCISEVLI